MPYVSKDDIMAYIPVGISLQQGVATTVEISLFKDYLNNQLNAADADSIVVTLYNSLGQKTYQYANPVVPGQTDRLNIGAPASDTQGIISFDVTAMQAANMAAGDVYAQVTITYSNYYPAAKTYVLPRLLIGDNNGSSVPGGTDSGTGTDSGSGATASNDVSGLSPYVVYDVSHVDGSQPNIKSVSFDSADPTAVTEIIFYNLDKNNHRNVYLENFLENRIANGVSGTITIVDADNAKDYSVYNITSYSRINAESGGGDDNDNDYTKLVVSYEDNSYTPIESPYTWAVGDTISYTLDAFGGASTGSTQPAQNGTSGSSGTSGIDGLPGRDGDNGTSGSSGTSGVSGTSGSSGTSGVSGTSGSSGTSGVSGTSGSSGTSGVSGTSGSSGTSGTSGVSGSSGTSGTSGAQGEAGTSGSSGTSGVSGTSGSSGTSGVSGTSGSSGTSGVSGTSGSSGTSGVSGTSGSSGTSGVSGTSGSSGTSGPQGPPGMGITFKGSVTTFTALPTAGLTIGDAYIADDTDHLYVWNGSEWADGGSIQGPAGNEGTSGSSGTSGLSGTSGSSGTSGLSGTSGSSGTSGVSGTSGSSGTSGVSGTSGSSGTSGISGTSGSSGTSGVSGTSGSSGTSGAQGLQGPAGDAGTSGSSGTSGAQGLQGPAGDAGSSGTSGSSGVSGDNGTSGSSGTSGAQGLQGPAGSSGTSGSSGVNGDAGTSGSSGTSGAQGLQGPAGDAGSSGTSGSSGVNGDAGSSGTSGSSGVNGEAGTSGSSGTSGAQGIQGPAGDAGSSGTSGSSGNDGVGIPSGGTSGQVLTKVDSSLYNVTWADPEGGPGAGYTKYLLRLNYDTQEELLGNISDHTFQDKAGYKTVGASVTAVTQGTTGSVSVQFNEDNPPISILVMAYNPVDDSYKVHHYDKDAANVIINTSSANFVGLGNNQYEPNFFGNFTVGMTIDTRQDFIKFGNSASVGFPPVTKNAHAYVIFVF